MGHTDTATVTVTSQCPSPRMCPLPPPTSCTVSVGGTANEANLDAAISLLNVLAQTSTYPAMR